jgi:hypothetical protein
MHTVDFQYVTNISERYSIVAIFVGASPLAWKA